MFFETSAPPPHPIARHHPSRRSDVGAPYFRRGVRDVRLLPARADRAARHVDARSEFYRRSARAPVGRRVQGVVGRDPHRASPGFAPRSPRAPAHKERTNSVPLSLLLLSQTNKLGPRAESHKTSPAVWLNGSDVRAAGEAKRLTGAWQRTDEADRPHPPTPRPPPPPLPLSSSAAATTRWRGSSRTFSRARLSAALRA